MIDSYTKRPRPLRDFDIEYTIDHSKCKDCLDKPCLESCPIDAILIDEDGLIKLHQACFGCVLCRNSCPYDAIYIKSNMAPPIRENVPNINKKLCKACGACVQACKTGSIHIKSPHSGEAYSEIDKDTCVRCGYCFRVCPTDAIKYGELIPKTVKGGKAIIVNQKDCIGCMTCTRVCPSVGAINVGKSNKLPYINPAYCARCEECMHSCPSGAIKYSSRKRAYANYNKLQSADLVYGIVDKDIKKLSLDLISLNPALYKVAKSLSLEFDESNSTFIKAKVNEMMKIELGLLLDSSIVVDKFNKLFSNYLIDRQINVISKNCIACGECLNVCPTDAINLNAPNPIEINDNCVVCGQCIEICKFDSIVAYDDYFYSEGEDLYYARSFLDGVRESNFELNSDKCQVCAICAKNCPTSALKLDNDKIIFEENECISCRECEVLCPLDAIKIHIR